VPKRWPPICRRFSASFVLSPIPECVVRLGDLRAFRLWNPPRNIPTLARKTSRLSRNSQVRTPRSLRRLCRLGYLCRAAAGGHPQTGCQRLYGRWRSGEWSNSVRPGAVSTP
jgi:hypothetical protein